MIVTDPIGDHVLEHVLERFWNIVTTSTYVVPFERPPFIPLSTLRHHPPDFWIRSMVSVICLPKTTRGKTNGTSLKLKLFDDG